MRRYIAVLFLFSCVNLNGLQKSSILSVVLYSVDIDIETPFCISPLSFENAFTSEIDTLIMAIDFYKVLKCNLNVQYIVNNVKIMDTRFIIKVNYKNGSEDTVYGNRFHLFYKNNFYRISPTLLRYIIED